LRFSPNCGYDQFAIEFFGPEGNEHHREIGLAREISVLYTLLVGSRGRCLGLALGASGTVGTLSLTLGHHRTTLTERAEWYASRPKSSEQKSNVVGKVGQRDKDEKLPPSHVVIVTQHHGADAEQHMYDHPSEFI
jgi:hypothetical protein